ncbi:MAG: TIGR02206 family membrane protein [Anaerolineae bacterium]|nr:MAG: TIGR02206 family membrane protein [Anaerolineae bacterium]
MASIFDKNWNGPAFVMFDLAHLVALFLVVLLNVKLLSLRSADETARHRARWAMALTLWANEIGWHLWHALTGQWTIQTMLPLHLCSVLVWGGALGLVTRNYHIYEFMYFLGIGGALQALLTPDLGIYGFPHYRFWQTFISHGLILTSAIYMTAVEGFRPTWKSLGRVLVLANLYMLVVFFINQAIGSNYLFIAHKPETASILDLLPPWPYYIAYIELIGLVTCLILYLPFALKDWRTKSIHPSNA